MKVVHRRYDCIACAACVNVAPNYWSIDEKGDGRADFLDAVMKREQLFVGIGLEVDREVLEESASVCPVACIDIEK